MKRGKQTCQILKDIRRQIAEANDIEYITSECRHRGDCAGTCPKCESEVRYLEQQLEHRRLSGLGVRVAGVSLGLTTLFSASVYGQEAKKDSVNMLPEVNVVGYRPVKKTMILGSIATVMPTPIVEAGDAVLEGSVETTPEYPGGAKALQKYLKENIHYPTDAGKVSGRVIVQFTVTKKGKVSHPKVVRRLHPLCDKEALRVIKNMPQWTPGTQMGKPINAKYTVPITFAW